jgi:hypothetical protein
MITDSPGAPHCSQREKKKIKFLRVSCRFIPLDSPETAAELITQIKTERGYANEDTIEVSEAKMGAAYASKLDVFFREHSHSDEEVTSNLAPLP